MRVAQSLLTVLVDETTEAPAAPLDGWPAATMDGGILADVADDGPWRVPGSTPGNDSGPGWTPRSLLLLLLLLSPDGTGIELDDDDETLDPFTSGTERYGESSYDSRSYGSYGAVWYLLLWRGVAGDDT